MRCAPAASASSSRAPFPATSVFSLALVKMGMRRRNRSSSCPSAAAWLFVRFVRFCSFLLSHFVLSYSPVDAIFLCMVRHGSARHDMIRALRSLIGRRLIHLPILHAHLRKALQVPVELASNPFGISTCAELDQLRSLVLSFRRGQSHPDVPIRSSTSTDGLSPQVHPYSQETQPSILNVSNQPDMPDVPNPHQAVTVGESRRDTVWRSSTALSRLSGTLILNSCSISTVRLSSSYYLRSPWGNSPSHRSARS